MKLYEKQFSVDLDQPENVPSRSYVIGSVPRCGSHLFGHSLAAENTAGVPYEYCNPANLLQWRNLAKKRDNASTLQYIMRRRTTPNGVFGIKLHFSHLLFMRQWCVPEEVLPAAKLILLRRKDLLGQAISYVIAKQTGSWIDEMPANSEPYYDRNAIDSAIRSISIDYENWEIAANLLNWDYIKICYEEFLDRPEDVINQTSQFIGIDQDSRQSQAGAQMKPPKKQGGNINKEWRARYLAETPTQRFDELFIRREKEKRIWRLALFK